MRITQISSLMFLLAAVILLSATSCKKDDPPVTPETGLNVPKQYSFENVNYGGQTVRLLLLKDLVAKIGEPGVTKADLVAIYENTAGKYAEISGGKNLSGKISGPDVDAQLRAWFDSVEVLSTKGEAKVLSNGFDLKEAIEKTIMGSVIYHRAMNDYLHKLSGDDNNTVKAGDGTAMEHHWDEAFGYFGAARDLNDWTDTEISSPGQKDVNNDGTIDPASERNFFFAQYAAKRDIGTASLGEKTDFTKEIFDAFLKGRAGISNKDYIARDEAIKTVNDKWQAVIAAATLHYANEVKTDLNGSKDASKHWTELYFFAKMFDYNADHSKVGQADRDKLKSLIGEDVKDITVSELDEISGILKNSFGFTDAQVNAW